MEEENPSSSSSSTNIKLLIEKGPKEGESIEYKSNKIIKIGRVVRGNTFQIKESGISSNHISIHFDKKWMLTDLDSSNGTFLNALKLQPNVATALNDGDCIKIGELTSIIVKIGMVAEPVVELRRNTRRQVRSKAVVEEIGEIGLDNKLGETVVEEGKRNLRGRGKKAVDTKNVVESASSKRTLRSSKKAEKVTEVPELSNIPEETTDVVVAVEPKNTRGRKKKLSPVDVSEGTGVDEQKLAEAVLVVGRRTRRGRMAVAVEPLKNVNDGNETVQVDEGNEAHNEPAPDQVVEKLVLMEKGCDGKESVAGGSSDKGKKVAEELESRQDGAEGSRKKTRKWDFETMTLGDFLDYIAEEVPKQIVDESEKVIADLQEKARQCFRIRQIE